MKISAFEVRPGNLLEYEGKLWRVLKKTHVKPGKGGAFVRTKIKNLISGRVLEETFRSGEKVGRPDLEEKNVQYLYLDSEGYCFMDNETYEQVFLSDEQVGDSKNYLQENINVSLLMYKGSPIGLDLPITVNLTVVETEPGVKGDTATGATKPAKLETGHVVNVPLFINEGDVLKIDTRTGDYLERAKA